MKGNTVRVNIKEALRFIGAGHADGDIRERTERIAARLESRLVPQFCYKEYSLEKRPEGVLLAGTDILLSGSLAEKMLADCRIAAVLFCTLGASFEAMLRTSTARDLSEAVILDACGSAYVEAGCDAAEEEIARRHPDHYLTDRFSPGYGDLSLDLQKELAAAGNVEKRLGIQVLDSQLMIPSKSVSAIIGIAPVPQKSRIRGCAYCRMRTSCSFSKGGKSCVF